MPASLTRVASPAPPLYTRVPAFIDVGLGIMTRFVDYVTGITAHVERWGTWDENQICGLRYHDSTCRTMGCTRAFHNTWDQCRICGLRYRDSTCRTLRRTCASNNTWDQYPICGLRYHNSTCRTLGRTLFDRREVKWRDV